MVGVSVQPTALYDTPNLSLLMTDVSGQKVNPWFTVAWMSSWNMSLSQHTKRLMKMQHNTAWPHMMQISILFSYCQSMDPENTWVKRKQEWKMTSVESIKISGFYCSFFHTQLLCRHVILLIKITMHRTTYMLAEGKKNNKKKKQCIQ